MADALIAELRATVKALKQLLSTLDKEKLRSLMDALPTDIAAGSAEMVMLVHLTREIDARGDALGQVINFPTR
ncbi:hypothetical protein NKH47_17680 [Mesorhizobium sp. M1060]|uniref:hypothetical protein n=1 Tax=unclassified Mesorhizobium TaxID=325217 RepID=UPI0003CF005E|nr:MULTISPECIES: hypothetical protein [unclassified Mesorhizobium]ESX13615.1 hypothetical protein X768_04450 [Mesorhizobium sp. LSJC265A00]ESX32859.1 hypothetical protein X765_03615 [Mesorhizobium sp. LSHC440B00]ESX40074.1 hypothetical protein X763_04810 [Mesorhizobium sp. LSHC432A00]ESX44968.1 hypothetical protein X764_03830 [Mesorhizobium sp. LSHC440A00]WJI59274.1 hypothetical protein NLY33_11430 [Mesorhizobium sp. C432A]